MKEKNISKRNTKKIFSIILSLAMVLAFIPIHGLVYAEGEREVYDAFQATDDFPYLVEYHWHGNGSVTKPDGVSDDNFVLDGTNAKVRVDSSTTNLTFKLEPASGEHVIGIWVEQDGEDGNVNIFGDNPDSRYNSGTNTFTLYLSDDKYNDGEDRKFVNINFDFSNPFSNFGPNEDYPYLIEYHWNGAGNVDRPADVDDDNFIMDGNNAKVRVASTVTSLTFVLHPNEGEGLDAIRVEQEGTDDNKDGFVSLNSDTRYNSSANTFTIDISDAKYNSDGSTKFVNINFDFTGGGPGGPQGPGSEGTEVFFSSNNTVNGQVVTFDVEGASVTVTISANAPITEDNEETGRHKIVVAPSAYNDVTFTLGGDYDKDTMDVVLHGDKNFQTTLNVDENNVTKLNSSGGNLPNWVFFEIEKKGGNNPPGPGPMAEGIQFKVNGPERGSVTYKFGDGDNNTLDNLNEQQSTSQSSEAFKPNVDTLVTFSITPQNTNGEFSVHIECDDQSINVGQEMDNRYQGGFMSVLESGNSVSFTTIANKNYVIRVDFGHEEAPWYTVSWAGGNVTVANGEVYAERIHVPAQGEKPAKTYTLVEGEVDPSKNIFSINETIGKPKENPEDPNEPDALQTYGLGFSQSDLFIRPDLEGISIDFKFVPNYGYQLKNIYTNEDQSNSLLDAFETKPENISTFTFNVRQGENVHFQVFFMESSDTVNTGSAQNINGATIANGGNAVSNGNLSLNVAGTTTDSSVENALSTFDVTLDNIVSKGEGKGNWVSNITEFDDPITLTFNLDTRVYSGSEYQVVREHDGQYETLNANYNSSTGQLSFETNKFSTYSITGTEFNANANTNTGIYRPSGGSSLSDNTFGGTIGGGTAGSATNITVNTTNGNAIITDIPASTIIDAANASTQSGGSDTDLVIDVSNRGNDGKEVTKVTLSKSTVEAISNTLNSATNIKENLVIKTSNATVSIDKTALAAIVSQAQSDSIQLVVENTKSSDLNNSQKKAVEELGKSNSNKNRSVVATFEAFFTSGGTRISSFKGGKVVLGIVDYNIPANTNPKNYHVYYMAENGDAQRYLTWVEKGTIFFKAPHFSDYAIVYDESLSNGQGKPVYRLYNNVSGDHLLTASEKERDMAKKFGYVFEGIAFYASDNGKKVYRLYNQSTGEHFYTVSGLEKDLLVKSGWKSEGVAFTTDGGRNVYRLYNGNLHFFTSSEGEKNLLYKLGWKGEGTGFMAF